MNDQIKKYSRKLISDRSVLPDKVAFAVQDDVVVTAGDPALASLAAALLERLGSLALCIAEPSLPFARFLLERTNADERKIIPRDTETRTFLHDIPVIRSHELGNNPVQTIATALGNRKGIIVEGVGVIAVGSLTVEQAFINWSSVFHSTFIKYLEDVMEEGFKLPDEAEAFTVFRNEWLVPLTSSGLTFRNGPLTTKEEILNEMACVGRYMVERGLVDSFFGNISCSDGTLIHISQTASSLDELAGCIDPVAFDNSSTAGITASSELVAHRRIFEITGCRTILHGHPRFSVVMSMLCDEREHCSISDCWKECPAARFLGGTPVVAGEIGAGGIARNVPPVIGKPGRAIVYGHGVFTIGRTDFAEAFQALIDVENWCRGEYFRRFDEQQHRSKTVYLHPVGDAP